MPDLLPFQQKSRIIANEQLAADVFRLIVDARQIAAAAVPGQFVMVRVAESLDPLLRRPFSIHSRHADGTLSLLFKIVGKGTALLAKAQVGDQLDLLGPLGKGFHLVSNKPVCLIGGGMGIAPLLFLAQELRSPQHLLLGARNQAELAPLAEAFAAVHATMQLATDDGSLGYQGFVPELLDTVLPQVSQVYTCGPRAMMHSVVSKCQAAKVPCQVSIETHMACGIGACLGCTVPSAAGPYVHVCKDGPVFNAEELQWQR